MSQSDSQNLVRRRAFSLLEILIVVGILTLLAALAVIGFRVVGGASRNRVTITALENAKGLLGAYELTSQVETLLPTSTVKAGADINRWFKPASNLLDDFDVLNCRVITPGTIEGGAANTSAADRAVRERYLRDETARVIRRLSSVATNRAAIEAMPAGRIVKIRVPIDPKETPTASDQPEYPTSVDCFEGVNLLDGDGKPVYFIPGGGLLYVNIGYNGTGDRADVKNYQRPLPVRSPDQKPFWASPGPDGDLTTGDDNVYSFEQ